MNTTDRMVLTSAPLASADPGSPRVHYTKADPIRPLINQSSTTLHPPIPPHPTLPLLKNKPRPHNPNPLHQNIKINIHPPLLTINSHKLQHPNDRQRKRIPRHLSPGMENQFHIASTGTIDQLCGAGVNPDRVVPGCVLEGDAAGVFDGGMGDGGAVVVEYDGCFADLEAEGVGWDGAAVLL